MAQVLKGVACALEVLYAGIGYVFCVLIVGLLLLPPLALAVVLAKVLFKYLSL